MNILQTLSNNIAWAKLFKQKKARLEGLPKDIELTKKDILEKKRSLDFAQGLYDKAVARLKEQEESLISLKVWVPENQPKFDEMEIVLSDKVTKAAAKVEKAIRDGLADDPKIL
jgi:hypothetical protein